jgi:hypothetical protein
MQHIFLKNVSVFPLRNDNFGILNDDKNGIEECKLH